MTPENSPNHRPVVPTARLQQLRSGPEDVRLTTMARARRPRVIHWWGRRSSETGAYALCYLCDKPMATWSARWPITVAAQVRIDWHREMHLQGGSGTLNVQEASE